jgi:hypothetical protein
MNIWISALCNKNGLAVACIQCEWYSLQGGKETFWKTLFKGFRS